MLFCPIDFSFSWGCKKQSKSCLYSCIRSFLSNELPLSIHPEVEYSVKERDRSVGCHTKSRLRSIYTSQKEFQKDNIMFVTSGFFFSYTLSALHRPRQNSAAGLAQAVHPKLLKGFFLSSLAKATSKLLFCLYWFSSLLKVVFYHSVTRCKEHFIE